MARLTLRTMTAPQVVVHYKALIEKRFDKAGALIDSACKLPRNDPGAKVLIDRANVLSQRAHALAKPRVLWQVDAARERLTRYGMKVAAAFMAANGWSKEGAYWVLFSKPYPYMEGELSTEATMDWNI